MLFYTEHSEFLNIGFSNILSIKAIITLLLFNGTNECVWLSSLEVNVSLKMCFLIWGQISNMDGGETQVSVTKTVLMHNCNWKLYTKASQWFMDHIYSGVFSGKWDEMWADPMFFVRKWSREMVFFSSAYWIFNQTKKWRTLIKSKTFELVQIEEKKENTTGVKYRP